MSPLLPAAGIDAAAAGWLHLAWPPLIAAVLWLAALPVLGLTRHSRRPPVRLALIAAGILISGWLTYTSGLAAGLLFLLLGGAALMFGTGRAPGRRVGTPALALSTSIESARAGHTAAATTPTNSAPPN